MMNQQSNRGLLLHYNTSIKESYLEFTALTRGP